MLWASLSLKMRQLRWNGVIPGNAHIAKVTKQGTENLNRPIKSNRIKLIIKKIFPQRKVEVQMVSLVNLLNI